MDKDELIKWTILHFLYGVRKEKGPYEPGDLSEIAEKFSIDESTFVERYAADLSALGLIELPYVGTIEGHITPQGMAIIDKNNPFVGSYKSGDVRNIAINAPVTNSQIVQGDNVTITVAMDFITNLQKEIDKSNLTDDEKKTWKQRLKELSTHPILIEALKKVLTLGS
jgi:hypothetical protein